MNLVSRSLDGKFSIKRFEVTPDNSDIVRIYTVLIRLFMLLFPKGKGNNFPQFLVFTNIVHL